MKEEKSLPKFGHANDIKDDEKVLILPEEESKQLSDAIKRFSETFTWKNVALRGLIGGLFTALGATVGIALLFYIIVGVYSGIQGVPILNQLMNATGLDKVVEYVIEQRNEPEEYNKNQEAN